MIIIIVIIIIHFNSLFFFSISATFNQTSVYQPLKPSTQQDINLPSAKPYGNKRNKAFLFETTLTISNVSVDIVHRERSTAVNGTVRGVYSDHAKVLFSVHVNGLYANANNTDLIYGGGTNSGVFKIRSVTFSDMRLIRYVEMYVYTHIRIHTHFDLRMRTCMRIFV